MTEKGAAQRSEIRAYPAFILRKNCVLVENITTAETEIFLRMRQIMRQHRGIGLAAPQIGIPRRMIVIDIGNGPVMLANPVIKERNDTLDSMVEGCLSLPGLTVEVKRPFEVLVTGVSEKGHPVRQEAEGLLARAFQHEIDHLNGRLIIDEIGLWGKVKYVAGKWRR